MAARAPSGLGRKLTRDHLLTGCVERRRPTLASSPSEFARSACLDSGPRSREPSGWPFAAGEMRRTSAALAPRDQGPYKASSRAL
jgi:hypothetical protein